MADVVGNDENESRRMDLNLYLAPPLHPLPPRVLGLGSDLVLCSLPMMTDAAAAASANNAADVAVDAQARGGDETEARELDAAAVVTEDDEIEEHDRPFSPAPLDDMDIYLDSSPSRYVAAPPFADATDELGFSFHLPSPSPPPMPIPSSSELGALEDASSSRPPEFRVGARTHLVRLRPPRSRPSFLDSGERSNENEIAIIQEEEHAQELEQLEEEGSAAADNFKAVAECPAVVSEEEEQQQEEERKKSAAANFECNICFDMANDPVVTSCGHLFCWACLYQWISVYTDHKECPVCKGEVTEANITPIYGRGGADCGKEEEKKSGVPPRPQGNRQESFRQQLRPFRRMGEGLVSSWRRIIDQHMSHAGRLDRHDTSFQEMLDTTHRSALARLRARRLERVAAHRNNNNSNTSSSSRPAAAAATGSGVDLSEPSSSARGNNNNNNTNNTSSLVGMDFWQQIGGGFGDVLTRADFQRIASPVIASRYHHQLHRASTSSAAANPRPPPPPPERSSLSSSDQVSPSSTIAVIQGGDVVDVSGGEQPAGNNNAGPSSSSRPQRRTRNSTSAFNAAAAAAAEGGGSSTQPRKRRRFN